jgi:hypothetical protein
VELSQRWREIIKVKDGKEDCDSNTFPPLADKTHGKINIGNAIIVRKSFVRV